MVISRQKLSRSVQDCRAVALRMRNMLAKANTAKLAAAAANVVLSARRTSNRASREVAVAMDPSWAAASLRSSRPTYQLIILREM